MRERPDQPKRICLVTSGHLATNPRLVKEADALSRAGYAVRVVACKFLAWADTADAEFGERPWWPVTWVRFGALASRLQWERMRIRKKGSCALVAYLGFQPALAKRALHYVVPELARAATAEPADLYVAHNLAALPAAARAAAQHGAKLGFDAEDFHRGELPETETHTLSAALTRWTENRYIPVCDYVTAASDGIAEAYEAALGISRPTTILNVFPLTDLDAAVMAADLAEEKAPGTRTLYWFSQTIGPNRGLETALEALPLLDETVHLALRGSWASGYKAAFTTRAEALGVRHRVRALPPAPPGELIVRTAQHDVGLALELPETRNRDICISNKLFTYLLAGVPVVASATAGQRALCDTVPVATRVIPHEDPRGLALAAIGFLDDGAARSAARAEAVQAARLRWNWEIESRRLVSLISDVLRHRVHSAQGMRQTEAV